MPRPTAELVWLCLVAVIARCVAVVWLAHYRAPIGSEYEGLAANLVDGKGYQLAPFFGLAGEQPTSSMAPVYPALLAIAFRLAGVMSGSSFLLVELVQAVVGSVTCLLIRWLGSESFDRTVGIAASWVWALYPAAVYMVTQHRPMTLVVFLLCSQTACLIRLGGPGWRRNGVPCGVLAGVFALTEPVALLFVGPSLVWVLSRGGLPLRDRVRSVGMVLAVSAVLVFPWTLRNWMVHGKLVAVKTSFGYQLWCGNNPHATGTLRAEGTEDWSTGELGWLSSDELWRRKQALPLVAMTMPLELTNKLREAKEIEIDAMLQAEGLRYIRAHPYRFINLTIRRIKYYWWFDPTNPLAQSVYYRWPWIIALPLAVTGVLISRNTWRRLLPLYLALLGFSLPYVVTVVEGRFRLAIEPVIVLFAAQTLGAALKVARARLAPAILDGSSR